MIYNIIEIDSKTVIPESITSIHRTKSRALEFYASRLALQKCLKEFSVDTSFEDINSFIIINHHYLKLAPSVLVSISHTKGRFAAASASSTKQNKSIGIDIELENRAFDPNTSKLFINQFDHTLAHSSNKNLLLLWTAKEAAFKALSPIADQYQSKTPLVLTDIWINSKLDFGITVNGVQKTIGTIEFQNLVKNNSVLIIALARIPN